MTTATAERADLSALSDAEVAEAWAAGDIDLAALEAECARRDAEAARAAALAARSDKARAAARARNAEWEETAYANYLQAEARCRGDANMLSEAGKRTGRSPWPMLWQGGREAADKLASDDLITFWDYESPRPPGPAEYAAAKREAAAEQAARHYEEHPEDAPKPAPKRQRRRVAKWIGVTGGAVRETPVRIGDLTVTAWAAMTAAGSITVHPSRDRAEAWLSPAPEPAPPSSPRPAMAPGAIARYTAALDILTARALAARARITNGGSR